MKNGLGIMQKIGSRFTSVFSRGKKGRLQQLINQFNAKDTYVIISDYPEKTKKGEKNYGIAWYTKELIEPLATTYGTRFVVLAEKGHNNQPQLFADGKILVLRVFDPMHHTLYPTILRWLNVFDRVKQIHVHSEFCTNGGLTNFALLIPFLALIKLKGKAITYFSHNVVTKFDFIATHLGLSEGSLQISLMNITLSYYYRVLGTLVNTFVVMDEVIYKRLSAFVGTQKVILLPFWVNKAKPLPSQMAARSALRVPKNKLVLLAFGFVTYYKGSDQIIELAKQVQAMGKLKGVEVVLAGGQAYSLKHKAYYQTFYRRLIKSIKGNSAIRITGFVPEEKIPMYFAAADLVIFPYRGIIGSSACFLHTLSFGKPFVISRAMDKLLENTEAKEALETNSVSPESLIFDNTPASFIKLVRRVKNKATRAKLAAVTRAIAAKRDKKTLVALCHAKLYSASYENVALATPSRTWWRPSFLSFFGFQRA